MKKISMLLAVLIVAVFAANVAFPAAIALADAPVVLRVSNWEDYIDEEVCSDFEAYMAEQGKSVKVEYSTYGTNENLYNDLKIANGYLYDVICPSDYMIEKMAKEATSPKSIWRRTETIRRSLRPIQGDFEDKITWNDGAESLSDYADRLYVGHDGLLLQSRVFGRHFGDYRRRHEELGFHLERGL